MRGHEAILQLRRRGFAPRLVSVETEGPAIRFDRFFPAIDDGYAMLQIEPHEPVHRVDLRCLLGLVVVVSGCNAERVAAVCAACTAAGAERVIGNTTEPAPGARFAVVSVTDTEGVFAWPT